MNNFDPKIFSAALEALARPNAKEGGKQSSADPLAISTSSLIDALAGLAKPAPKKVLWPNPSSTSVLERALAGLAKGDFLPERLPPPKLPRNLHSEDELRTEIKKIFRERWTSRDGQVVPDPKNLALGNDAVKLEAATVLYADMSGSTSLVDDYRPEFAAEVYKAYLASAARIIKDSGGTITAYDGDRIMAVFIGDFKNTSAVKAALKINCTVSEIINPALREQYGDETYQMSHAIGIDTSPIFASRIGVRNDNDIVWVGRAANYAAKLSATNDNYSVYITADVYSKLHESGKFGGEPRRLMWDELVGIDINGIKVYGSDWIWTP